MLELRPATEKRIRRFLAAHEQHDVRFTVLSKETMERIKVIGRRPKIGLEVHLSCHNGNNWMGFTRYCTPSQLDDSIRDMIGELKHYRPDLAL
jgi:hypothetical protein